MLHAAGARRVSATAVLATAAAAAYPIGTPGRAWGAAERAEWLATRKIVRSYHQEVLERMGELEERYVVTRYGALSHDKERYPLYSVRTRNWSPSKPSVLVTGGVHGYETSGVQGALLFLLGGEAEAYSETFNIMVAPCISPWGYETIQRWNAQAVDPNRSFNPHGEVVEGRSFNPEAATEESSALIAHLNELGVDQWMCHIDLHETTDTDESEFCPAKAARNGEPYTPQTIPDGFYLVSDITEPQAEWHKAMIEAVRQVRLARHAVCHRRPASGTHLTAVSPRAAVQVTHIAPPDEEGLIIGEPVLQDGVIGIPSPRTIGLCAGVTNARYATTTEVYPDSPQADDEQCNRAQVACITAGLDHIMAVERLGAAMKAEL